jgi:flagellin
MNANDLSLNQLVDEAILQINAHRSYFGAFYGRLEHNINNLSAQTENLTAALSRVQDTDYGAETANLTRVQILQQAATAMLAQANAMPNVILGLLRQQ